MTVGLRVDQGDPTPPYEQLRRQLVTHVATGAVAEGTRLPPVRQLAGDLGVAAGTVARAYKELEAMGVVRTARRAGTVVAEGAHETCRRLGPPGDRTDVVRLVDELVAAARASGLGDDELVTLVRRASTERP